MGMDLAKKRALLDRLFGGTALTPPATWYIALYRGQVQDPITFHVLRPLQSEVDEGVEFGSVPGSPDWTNYQRLAVPNDTDHWELSATDNGPSKIANKTKLRFGVAQLANLYFQVSVYGFALWDAPTGGNRWFWGSFLHPYLPHDEIDVTTDVVVTHGKLVAIHAGDLVITAN